MATIANPFPAIRRKEHEPAITTETARLQDFGEPSHLTEDKMPPNTRRHGSTEDDFDLRETVHILALSSTQTNEAVKALTAQVQAQAAALAAPKTNGNSNRSTIIAALLISFIPQAFGVVWWTRGTERDTASRVGTVELKMDQYEKRETIREREVRLLQQYNMNLQLWMRERGIKGAPTPPKIEIDKEN